MNKTVSALLLFASVSASAMAADAGGYVAIDLGPAVYNGADFAGPFSNITFPNPGAIHLGGGYRFLPYVGVEGGLVSLGDSTVTSSGVGWTVDETLKTSVLYVAATGILPLSSKFDLFGKLGLANTTIDYSSTGNFVGANYAVNGSKTNVMIGLGGQFNFNPHWSLRMQYEDFGKTDLAFKAGWVAPAATTKSIGVSTFSVGGMFTF